MTRKHAEWKKQHTQVIDDNWSAQIKKNVVFDGGKGIKSKNYGSLPVVDNFSHRERVQERV